MEVTFLGTGSLLGVPVWSCSCKVCTKNVKEDKRNLRTRPALMVQSGDKTVVIDSGADFRDQMLREHVKKIDVFLLTHAHSDHSACITELRAAKDVTIALPKEVFDGVNKRRNAFDYITTRNPSVKITHKFPITIGKLKIDKIAVKHEKDIASIQTPTYGYLFEENGKRVVYIPDFNEVIDKEKIQNLDLFIVDGAVWESKWGHLGILGGIKLFKEVKPKQMLFTHLNHDKSHEELANYLKEYGNIAPAYDGLKVRL